MHTYASDIGLVRNENQDKVGVWDKEHITLAILCDGMGGHYGGKEASSLVVLAFEKEFANYNVEWTDQNDIQNWFYIAVKKAKDLMMLKTQQNELFKDMGTTLTAAIINHKTKYIYIINIGDSRTYVFGNNLKQITYDHNLQNYYIHEFNYSLRKASKLPNAKGLVSALGPTKRTQMEVFIVEPSKESKLVVLTSDGIHDHVSLPVFEETLKSRQKDLHEKALELIDLAKRNNSLDNLSIIIVEI
ncbi:Serine/threonine phosphatase stp [Mycoplasmopsis californica]|uniref:Protein phosphatase 2C domain-containing protein n=1 Tax=Mycoplasmopsis equigenitalium TaxID=114883 RepID=A0ABY5J357_9BACT|nr:protein phosphatase 2C domain-containing protein [Mycoplasmopsis equigenitalium]UUD37164.1 protein phosphatase 2C domain-containing protein [Mycoplasmopsis equigenitalium]VEU69530.1 Serine/threonine phosphatase stp [Mycoplasmopsis californica]